MKTKSSRLPLICLVVSLPTLIHAHAGNGRVKYIEKSMTVSVPEPVEAGR